MLYSDGVPTGICHCQFLLYCIIPVYTKRSHKNNGYAHTVTNPATKAATTETKVAVIAVKQ